MAGGKGHGAWFWGAANAVTRSLGWILGEDSGNVPSQVPSRQPSDGRSQIPSEDTTEDHGPEPSHRYLVSAWLCRHVCQRTTTKGRHLHAIRMKSSACNHLMTSSVSIQDHPRCWSWGAQLHPSSSSEGHSPDPAPAKQEQLRKESRSCWIGVAWRQDACGGSWMCSRMMPQQRVRVSPSRHGPHIQAQTSHPVLDLTARCGQAGKPPQETSMGGCCAS